MTNPHRLQFHRGPNGHTLEDATLGRYADVKDLRSLRRHVRDAIKRGAVRVAGERDHADATEALVWAFEVVVSGNQTTKYHLNETAALVILSKLRGREQAMLGRDLALAFARARKNEPDPNGIAVGASRIAGDLPAPSGPTPAEPAVVLRLVKEPVDSEPASPPEAPSDNESEAEPEPPAGAMVRVKGVPLRVDGPEPLVRDIDLAKHYGLKNPRDIRQQILDAVADGAIDEGTTIVAGGDNGSEAENGPTVYFRNEVITLGSGAKRTVRVGYLNEIGALVMATRLRTPIAIQSTRALAKAFVAFRRGRLRVALPPVTTTPAPQAMTPAIFLYLEKKAALERALRRGDIALEHYEAKLVEFLDEADGTKLSRAPKALVFEPMRRLAANQTVELKEDGKAIARAHGLVDPGDNLTATQIAERFPYRHPEHGDLKATATQVNHIARALGIYGDEAGGWGIHYTHDNNLATDAPHDSQNWLHSQKAVERLKDHVIDVARGGQPRLLALIAELNPAYAAEVEAKKREADERRRRTNEARRKAGGAK